MSEPFIGEIRIVPYNFAPLGWADCNGQLLSIAENDALFALIGTTYGGDGQTTFGLPDFRSRVIMGVSNNHVLGEMGGEETHTLITSEMPAHNHLMSADNDQAGVTPTPTQGVYATLSSAGRSDRAYATAANTTANPSMIQPVGGSQPHDNRMPYLGMRAIIALQGVFPPRN